MGTLTAGQPRLDHYCEHKLPTSCRLTSIGECCACYDERAHASYYSTYIDGIGFVPRGNRWQRYCWFCKEFWENRVNASGLRPAQTRIPEVPDQSEFLAKWYEFHQGYRIVKREDGTEERVAVLGEDLREVDPGVLPRTLDELRAGRDRSELEEQERARREQQNNSQEQPADNGPSLDEALDEMFQAAQNEEREAEHRASAVMPIPTHHQPARGNIHAQAMTPIGSRNQEYQARRIAALRRELHRMRNGIERVISGLRDLGEQVPDHTQATSRLSELGQTLDTISEPTNEQQAREAIHSVNALTEPSANSQSDRTLASMQTRVDEARHHVNEARRNRDQAALELEAAEQEFRTSQSRLRQLQSEQRTTENYMRLFGTREEMLAQGDQYESPIGGMFTRAYERFRAAEEVRREERTLRQVLEDEERAGGEHAANRLAELENRDRDVWGVPRPTLPPERPLRQPRNPRTLPWTGLGPASQDRSLDSGSDHHRQSEAAGLEEYYTLLRRQNWQNEGEVTASETVNDDELDVDEPWPTVRPPIQNASLGDLHVDQPEPVSNLAGAPGEHTDENPIVNNDHLLDAIFILRKLCLSYTLQAQLSWNIGRDVLEGLLHNAESNSLDDRDRANIEDILEEEAVVWNSGLPAERIRRRRERGELVTFSEDSSDNANAGLAIVHDLELMAESFQMSVRVRELSGLPGPEQIHMLNSLENGIRHVQDRNVLHQMMQNEDVFGLARTTHEQRYGGLVEDSGLNERIANLERDRREAARQGDHSRMELDAQRRATRTLALAAGRTAMRTGPHALLEQMAERDEATRVAYERLQENGFVPPERMATRRLRERLHEQFYHPLSLNNLNLNNFTASPSATDSDGEDEEEARGLDAKDTGRPDEPLSDDEMTVKLDCQVCYSQLADVACLPCGHLVMCKWCSDQHSPTMAHDRTRPRRAASCPVCRKQIRQKVRVFRS